MGGLVGHLAGYAPGSPRRPRGRPGKRFSALPDEWRGYKTFSGEMKGRETVNHSRDEYVNGNGATTNQAEAYFGQLKRSIDGTHHSVSREHLHRYLDQHDFLRSTFRMGDSDRMRTLVEQVAGRRLTQRPLKGER